MAIVSFPTLNHLSGSDLLDLIRRYAKKVKKGDPAGRPLAWHQDQVALSLGFNNWSMLHKYLAAIDWTSTDHVLELVLKKPGLGQFVSDHAIKTVDEEEGADAMKAWVRAKFTPLIDFAFYDNEAPNGFSWPEEDIWQELQDEFSGQYPDDLVERVARKLEADHGPWGLEDYGRDEADEMDLSGAADG